MIIHHPKEVAFLATEKHAENREFKHFLKSQNNKQLDQEVAQIQEEIESKINCTTCANCCKKLEAGITPEEAKRLADLQNTSLADFITTATEQEKPSGVLFLSKKPCIFLLDNKCTIYISKPESCSTYPHLSGENFKYRLRSVFTNYALCPIVYNTIEQLKTKLNFPIVHSDNQ